MKKHIIGKVLATLTILVASSYFFNIQAQPEVVLEFPNTSGKDLGNPDGIGGRISGEVLPEITLEFKVSPAGQIDLEASTLSENVDNKALMVEWSKLNVGNTALESIRGKSFKLILTSNNKRLQCRAEGGIGIQGTNQWRMDGRGGEKIYFILQGDVGIDFLSVEYWDITWQDGQANFEIRDWNSKEVFYMEDIEKPDKRSLDLTSTAETYQMRYKSDTLTVTTSDTTEANNNNPGGRLWGLSFNVVEALPKPPAIASVVPPRGDPPGDSLTFTISDDIEIQFDNAMDRTKTAAAVSISPEITNRVDTWSVEDDGDLLTIAHDVLSYETWYTLVVSDAAEATNGLTMLAPDTIRFKTLPKPPEVVTTFPAHLEENVLPNTPMSIEFSKSMIPDSVEKGISFDPAVTGVSYVWSADNKTVYISANQLEVSTMYFVSVGEPAMDDFKTQLEEPYIFVFTTAIATSVENDMASDVVIYPNPASEILRIGGMDVASLRIYNLSGQLLKEIRNSPEVNVSDMETGIYVVSVSDREGNNIRKMVVIE